MRACVDCTDPDGCLADQWCREWLASLTPEEQAQERASMDSYEPDREEMGDPV